MQKNMNHAKKHEFHGINTYLREPEHWKASKIDNIDK